MTEGGEDRRQAPLLEPVDSVGGLPVAGDGTDRGHRHGGRQRLPALGGALLVPLVDLRLPTLGALDRLLVLALRPRLIAFVGGGLALRRERFGAAAQHPVAEDRHDRQGHEQGGEQREGDSDGERTEELAGDPVDEGDGQEHGDRRQGRGGDGPGDLFDGGDDVRDRQIGRALAPPDVLDDDDRVVDDAADGDRQGAEGEDVERVIADHESDHRDEQRHRDGDRGDDRRPERSEEREDDEDREEEAEAALDGEVLDRLLDLGGLVEDRREFDVGAELRPDGLKNLADPIRDLDDVVVLPLRHGDGDGILAAGAGERGLLDRVEGDVGDVFEQHRAAGRADGGVADLVDGVHLGADLDGERSVALPALTGGHDGARPGELIGHRGGDDALVVDVVRAEGDVDPLFGLAGHLDAGDAVDGLQLGDEVRLEAIPQGLRVPAAGDGEHHDGEIVDLLGQDLDLGVVGEVRLRGIDGGADGIRHLLGVLAEGPGHRGGHHSRRRRRLHGVEVADGVERRLQRLRHGLLDDLGRGAGDRGLHRGAGQVDRGHRLLVERGRRDDAEDGDDEGEQSDDEAILQAHPGQLGHGFLRVVTVFGRAAAPSVRREVRGGGQWPGSPSISLSFGWGRARHPKVANRLHPSGDIRRSVQQSHGGCS